MNSRRPSRWITLIFLVTLVMPWLLPQRVQAAGYGPVYVVQEGDTLYSIAAYFHTTSARLANYNYITDANLVVPGRNLYIPGFDDLSGTLKPQVVGLGDTPASLQRMSGTDAMVFRRINFLTSNGAVYAGQKLFILSEATPTLVRVPVPSGLTDLELAAAYNVNPWTAALSNGLMARWRLLANDILFLPAQTSSGDILPGIDSLASTALGQGKTATITASGEGTAGLSGSLLGYPLHFFAADSDSVAALQGVPRMTGQDNPNLDKTRIAAMANLILTSQAADGSTFSFEQNLPVAREEYGYDSPLQVQDNTIDPQVTEPEQNFMLTQVAEAPAEKLWSGAFQPPTKTPDCKASTYGRLRSFNGSDYIYFHSGTDYCGQVGAKILAAADGVVVYTGSLTVRGNATIISHGHGVYSAYYHQSKIEVSVGQTVKTGDEIGLVGETGRVTGPHLHFEVWVGSVQVDPDDWLRGLYP